MNLENEDEPLLNLGIFILGFNQIWTLNSNTKDDLPMFCGQILWDLM